MEALLADLAVATAALDALESAVRPCAAPSDSASRSQPCLMTIVDGGTELPAFFAADDELLTFREPWLRAAFFHGFHADNEDGDEDTATPPDHIAYSIRTSLMGCDRVFQHLRRRKVYAPAPPSRSIAPVLREPPPLAVPQPTRTAAFHFTT